MEHTIQSVAKQFQISSRTLRYYEELGLIKPKRTETGRRLYSKRDIAKLKLVFRGKRYGFKLEEIKEMILLFDLDQTGIKQLERTIEYGQQKVQEIDGRIAELCEMREEILLLQEKFQQKLNILKEEE